jgi:hypothetical protein
MKKPDPDKEKNVRSTTLQIANRVSAKNSSPVSQKKLCKVNKNTRYN